MLGYKRVLVSALCVVAATAGAWWLGPAGGWTRAGGSSGYFGTTEYPREKTREALWWGLAGGFDAGPWTFRARGDMLSPGGRDRVSYSRDMFDEGSFDYDYREGGVDLAADARPGEGVFLLGGRASWLHAARDGVYTSLFGAGEVTDTEHAFVNDVFLAPAAGVAFPAGGWSFRAALAPGWRRHNEYTVTASRAYYETGGISKIARAASLNRDYVAAQGELGATWRPLAHFGVTAWLEGRTDLFRLDGGDDDADPRWDLTVGVAPGVEF